MSDQDLIDQITTSAHRTDHLYLDPAALITTGRRRLHRRRAAAAASAIVTLAAAVAVTLTGVRSTAEPPPVAATPSGPDLISFQQVIPEPVSTVMRYHLGLPRQDKNVRALEWSSAEISTKLSSTDGTVAILVVTRRTTGGPQSQSPDVCRISGEFSAFTTCSLTTVSGRQVRIGERADRAFFASTTRADGSLVMALLDKDANAPMTGVRPSLFYYDLNVTDLVELVTDPQVPSVK